ncbi:DUF6031 family protein [Robbsia andropogonis]|uniref:DUF6031 family protein n=2 Tax=Robbsia andropogonis TaxID=28092 RepID=UPI003450E038
MQSSMISAPNATPPCRWFPRLSTGHVHDGAMHAETLASVSWMLMTELQSYIEDLEGAANSLEVVNVLRIKLAELLVDIDCRLAGAAPPDELHQFPLFAEYGVAEVTTSACDNPARWIGIGQQSGELAQHIDAAALIDLFNGLLAAFPGELFNPLLPDTQGQVLRTLRNWDKLCRLAGRDAAFLAPLMRSL